MSNDYIKQLEQQNDELRQMLASAEQKADEQAEELSALMAENIALRAELGQLEDEDEQTWK